MLKGAFRAVKRTVVGSHRSVRPSPHKFRANSAGRAPRLLLQFRRFSELFSAGAIHCGERRSFMKLFCKTHCSKFRRLWLGPLLTLCVGCADGPFGLARFNPMLRDEWKKDEE